MIKRIKEFWVNDFKSVQYQWKYMTKGKMPNWATIVMYGILLLFGLILTPFALIWRWRMLKKLENMV